MNPSRHYVVLRLAVFALWGAAAAHGAQEEKPTPDLGADWFSMPDGVEFQPASDSMQRLLLSGHGSTSGYESEFIDGSETYYNDYAQAWRLLGFYIDCNAPHNNYNECDSDGDGGGGNSGDNGGGDSDYPACQRYLLWAAVSATYCYSEPLVCGTYNCVYPCLFHPISSHIQPPPLIIMFVCASVH